MYPLHLENQYEKFFEKQFENIAKRLNREVINALKNETRSDGDLRRDTPLEEIMALILSLKDQFGDWIDPAKLEKQIARNFHLLDAWSRDKTADALSTLLSRLNSPQLPSVTGRPTPTGATGELWLSTVNLLSGNTGMTAVIRDRMIKQNLGLIRSLASEHLDDMTRILGDGLTQGKSLKEMTDSIEHLTGVNRSKAKFWAADQASKFFGEVTKTRQTAAGIPGYIWRTMKDGRVRDRHAALNGRYFDWKKPPAAGPKGEPGHPGDTYRCRCFAEPAFGPEYEDKNPQPEDPLAYMRKNTPTQELHQHERVIKNQRAQETMQVFDENGKFVTLKHGNANSVTISRSEARKLNNKILTHNHPSGWKYPESDPRHGHSSFSIEDISTACKVNLKEIRAVTPKYRYIMKRPESGWNKKYFDKTLNSSYLKHQTEVQAEFMKKVNKGTMTLPETKAYYQHEVWSRVSKELNIEYIREEI